MVELYEAQAPSFDEIQEAQDQIESLQAQGFTRALAQLVCRQADQFPLRIWLLDNSGSMQEPDGRKLVDTATPSLVKWEQCTRWEELQECVLYHAQLAALLQAPTQFHLLNDPGHHLPQRLGVAEMGSDMVEEELCSLQYTLKQIQPNGVTPTAHRIRQIYQSIFPMESSWRKEGKKVVIVLATDGLPTDERGHAGPRPEKELEQALQQLQTLPVWIVVRLLTDQASVVKYYQELDDRLEWSLEVLDDFRDEAKEIHHYNPWVTYALPLQRCREMGCHDRLLDLLDERPLTCMEMREFIELVLGATATTALVDPQADWEEFRQQVQVLLDLESSKPWNPIHRRVTPWIDMKQLDRCYGPRSHFERYFALFLLGIVGVAGTFGLINLNSISIPSRNQLEGYSSMALGAVTLVVMAGKRPSVLWNSKLVAAISIGLMIVVGNLWNRPAEFWQGLGWIAFGLIVLVVAVLLKLRDM